VARNLFHRNFPTRRSVASIVDTPRANGLPAASVYDHARRRINPEIARARHLATRSANDGFRRCISAGGTIENQERIIEVDDQKITDRINGDGWLLARNLRLRSLENS